MLASAAPCFIKQIIYEQTMELSKDDCFHRSPYPYIHSCQKPWSNVHRWIVESFEKNEGDNLRLHSDNNRKLTASSCGRVERAFHVLRSLSLFCRLRLRKFQLPELNSAPAPGSDFNSNIKDLHSSLSPGIQNELTTTVLYLKCKLKWNLHQQHFYH